MVAATHVIRLLPVSIGGVYNYTYRYIHTLSCINVFQSPTGYYKQCVCVCVCMGTGTWIKGKDGLTQGCHCFIVGGVINNIYKGACSKEKRQARDRTGSTLHDCETFRNSLFTPIASLIQLFASELTWSSYKLFVGMSPYRNVLCNSSCN